MEILRTIVYLFMLLSAVGIVILVLLQHGKGADMGTGFGAGASGSLFGATGSANFLSRMTAVLAAVFFACTLGLSYFASHRSVEAAPDAGLLPSQSAPVVPAQPGVTPAPAAAAPVPEKGNEVPK